MAVIGCLGDIVFEASGETVRTLRDFQWGGTARYAMHQRILNDALTEFVGSDPDKITFNIDLSAYLGVSPSEEIAKIWAYERGGTAVSLVLGDHDYGKYKWNIVSHSVSAHTYDAAGNILTATVSLSLQAYLPK